MKVLIVEAVGMLNNLCRDPKNVVFIVSGKVKKTLAEWFTSCGKLGLAGRSRAWLFFEVRLFLILICL